jgi:hypothetical protein
MVNKSTEEAAMLADMEIPADRQQLQYIIKEQAKILAKKMI